MVVALPNRRQDFSYRVLQVSKVRMNPYVRLLQEALQGQGIVCSSESGFSPGLLDSWLVQTPPTSQRETTYVVHLHWLELLYTSSTWVRSVRLLAVVLAGLVRGRMRGCKLVYTVHNLNPHEQAYPWLSRIANRVLFSLADALHVHDVEAQASIARKYGRHNGVYVIPHGSYLGAYADGCTRQEARKRLGLADHAFVYLFLGQVRRYKGIEDLVDAFGQLEDRSSFLVIAGNPHDAQYGAELVDRIGQPHRRDGETLPRPTDGETSPRPTDGETLPRPTDGETLPHPTDGETSRPEIRTWLHYVPDSELQYFLRASDVAVLPYRDMTTSGAAILAFSFGVPIIAPARAGFLELAADGRGITYDPEAPGGLVQALHQARNQDMAESGRKALAWAKEHQWGVLVHRFVEMYADIAQPGR